LNSFGKRFKQRKALLPCPAVSPDFSPIEHVWDEMERRLRHLPNQPVTLAEMGPALKLCITKKSIKDQYQNKIY
jgi:transposase